MIFCNIGDVQAMGNQPITFIRQLITVCLNPGKYFVPGVQHSATGSDSSKHRAKQLLETLSGELPSNERQRLLQLVDGLPPAVEERVGEILDDIPTDVKERANLLLNSLGGRSLGT